LGVAKVRGVKAADLREGAVFYAPISASVNQCYLESLDLGAQRAVYFRDYLEAS